MKKQFSAGAEDLDGFEDLKDEDKARIHLAFKEGKVADEDIPDTARKPLDATSKGDDKPKNKSSGKKKVGADIDEGDTEKPKGARVRKSRAKVSIVISCPELHHLVCCRWLRLSLRRKMVQSQKANPRRRLLLRSHPYRRRPLPKGRPRRKRSVL